MGYMGFVDTLDVPGSVCGVDVDGVSLDSSQFR